jgi:hypothetical protein
VTKFKTSQAKIMNSGLPLIRQPLRTAVLQLSFDRLFRWPLGLNVADMPVPHLPFRFPQPLSILRLRFNATPVALASDYQKPACSPQPFARLHRITVSGFSLAGSTLPAYDFALP